MRISKILVSQPKPTSEKSPYFDLETKYGVSVVFRPFIKVEGLSSKEFRKFKVNPADFTAVIFTARTAVDHYFRLAKELRFDVPDTMKYFCLSQTVAHYLQKYIQYRKRKIFYSENGKVEELITLIEKHKKEKFIFPMSDVHDTKASLIDEHQIKYTPAIMYRTVSNDFEPGEPFDYDMIILFTPSGIKSLLHNFPDFVQGNIAIGGMGPKTIEEIKNSGLRLDITTSPKAPSIPAAIDQYLAKVQKEEHRQQLLAEKKAAEEAKKKKAKRALKKTQSAPATAEELAHRRSEAAKKAAATRKAKRDAEAEKARRRSEAAKKAAATRKAMRAEAARIAAEKAEAERIAAEQAAAERARRRSEAAKKAAATRNAKRAAEAEKARRRSEAAKKAAATRAAKRAAEAERIAAEKAEAERIAAEKAEAERIAAENLARKRSEAAKKAAATRAAKRAATTQATKKAATTKKATAKKTSKK